MDLIDRAAAIEHLRNNIAYMRAFGCDRAITLIREVPSVQPEERTDKRAEMHACDLISRQAAIDAVADGIISEEESLVECARECNSMIEWAVEALKELPSAQPEQRWIPCSERLPKPYEYCLWTTTDGRVIYHHCDGLFSNYTAWMPLPEPWEGEQDANR